MNKGTFFSTRITTATPKVSCKHGAPMGRTGLGEARPQPLKGRDPLPDYDLVSLRRIRLDRSGYDAGGAYWGLGAPLWYAGSDEVDMYFRASDRDAAKAHVRNSHPSYSAPEDRHKIRFYR